MPQNAIKCHLQMFLQITVLKLDFKPNPQDYDISQICLLFSVTFECVFALAGLEEENTILESHFWKFGLCQILWEIVGREEKNDISCQLVLEAECPLYSKFRVSRRSLAVKLQTSIIFPRSKLSRCCFPKSFSQNIWKY